MTGRVRQSFKDMLLTPVNYFAFDFDHLPTLARLWDESRMDGLLLLAAMVSSLGYEGWRGDFVGTPDAMDVSLRYIDGSGAKGKGREFAKREFESADRGEGVMLEEHYSKQAADGAVAGQAQAGLHFQVAHQVKIKGGLGMGPQGCLVHQGIPLVRHGDGQAHHGIRHFGGGR